MVKGHFQTKFYTNNQIISNHADTLPSCKFVTYIMYRVVVIPVFIFCIP